MDADADHDPHNSHQSLHMYLLDVLYILQASLSRQNVDHIQMHTHTRAYTCKHTRKTDTKTKRMLVVYMVS